MNRISRYIVFIVCIVSIAAGMPGARAWAKETITWFQPDFPPYVIVNDRNHTQGIDNQIIQYVIKHLPEYHHSFQVASYKRILMDLKFGKKGVVNPLFITPERQQYLVYSNVANYLALSNGFVINKGDLERFRPYMSSKGDIDIKAVLSEKYFIGIASGRSYYGIIDDMIRKYKPSGILYERTGTDHLGILKMLATRRIDAAFGFPVEVQYLSKKLGIKNDLIVLPVQEMVPYSPTYFAAPKNEWGRTLIRRINNLINQQGVISRFNDYYANWLDEGNKKYYRELEEQHYRTQ